jgi:hypothetical protein
MPFDIRVHSSPAAIDPHLSDKLKPNRPAVGTPTSGPNRHTTFVPSESTTFSLGEKCPERINDVGITGRTDNHVHLHVRTNNKTLVTLGSGATEVVIDAHDAKVPTKSTGYAMVTDQNAWHDSALQHFIVSRCEDVVIRAPAEGKSILLQADAGHITAVAKETATFASLGQVKLIADPDAQLEGPAYEKGPEGKVKASFESIDHRLGGNVAKWITGAYGVMMSLIVANGKDPFWEKPKFKPKNLEDVVDVLYDMDKLRASIYKYFTHHDGDPGKLSLAAAKSASVGSLGSLSLYGVSSASMISEGGLSLMGLQASLKALHKVSVWGGRKASIKAGKEASLEGEWGMAKVKGYKGVEVTSTKESAVIQGFTDASLRGTTGGAYVHSAKHTYVGSGAAAGYGIVVLPDKLSLGKVSSGGDEFEEKAKVEPKKGIAIDDKTITMGHGSAKFVMRQDDVKLNAHKEVWLKLEYNGGVTLKTKKKILIGV